MRSKFRKSDDGLGKGGQPLAIGSLIDTLLERWLPDFRVVCKEWEVVERWHEIVIEPIKTVSECSRVENGILYVRIESASWRQEAAYQKEPIKARIRLVTGCETIRDIVFY